MDQSTIHPTNVTEASAPQAPSASAPTPSAPPPQDHGLVQDPNDIAVDDGDNSSLDGDSAIGDDASVYTASLTSSLANHRFENGRRYAGYRDNAYVFPNDEAEQERMDLQHEMYMVACAGKLHIAPLSDMKGKRILDIGTGTGIWCMEMGDKFPDAEVIGVDLSPVQPSWVPENVKFEIDDVEAPWTFPQKFDYIHSRFMAASIANWPGLIRQCYDNLAPGGILEMQDGDFLTYSEDGSNDHTKLREWNVMFRDAAAQGGRIVQPGLFLEQWVKEAGFEDVYHERVRLPLGTWPKDKTLKIVGAFNLVQLKEGLEGFSLALFTHVLGWTVDQVQVLLAGVRADLSSKDVHAQNDMHIVWGRKPMN